jgi:hypothetical protein
MRRRKRGSAYQVDGAVKGYTPMVNSVYNGWRMEDVWLDK